VTSLDWKSQCLENPSVPLLWLADKKSRIYRDSNKLFFYKRFAQNLAKFLLSKNLADHWDLPNTGIFYAKDVASAFFIVNYSLWIFFRIQSKNRRLES
jgi:hypothetical protein